MQSSDTCAAPKSNQVNEEASSSLKHLKASLGEVLGNELTNYPGALHVRFGLVSIAQCSFPMPRSLFTNRLELKGKLRGLLLL